MFTHNMEYILFLFMLLFFIIMLFLIIKDLTRTYKKYKEKKTSMNLSFDKYKEIKEDPSKYIFYVPYGITQSLIQFISETPYFIDAINNATEKNRFLIDNYKNETDQNKISLYINIGIQLSNIIANTGKILINQCNFYCENSSDSFEILCDSKLVQQYCMTADSIHDQFEKIKEAHIKTPEIKNTLDHMYRDFFNYFERINSLVRLIPNQKGDSHNDK